ncbi:unnamed protein product [Prunus armeniaca]
MSVLCCAAVSAGNSIRSLDICNLLLWRTIERLDFVCTISGQALPSQSKQRKGSPTSTKHKKMRLSLTYKRRLLSFKKGGRVRHATRAPYGL